MTGRAYRELVTYSDDETIKPVIYFFISSSLDFSYVLLIINFQTVLDIFSLICVIVIAYGKQ